MQYGFFIDAKYCLGCKTCQVACKDRSNLEVGQLFRKVHDYEDGGWVKRGNAWINNVTSYWLSVSCNHCANPACVKACPTGAMYKRTDNGLVLHDAEDCVGCQSCVWACPYDAPQYNPETGRVHKCDGCIDRVEAGLRPVCVDACPYQLIEFGDIEELRAKHGGTDRVKGLADPGITSPSLVINPPAGAISSPNGGNGK